MLTIMKLAARSDGGHDVESQSGRNHCWLEGWIEVPPHLESRLWSCCGYCEPVVTDGVLTDLKPVPRPEQTPAAPTELEKLRADVDFLAAVGGVEL